MSKLELYATGRPDIIWPDYRWRGEQRYSPEEGFVYDVTLITHVRIFRDGIYWFKRIEHKTALEQDPHHRGLHACYAIFTHEVYNFIVLARPSADITTISGEPVFWRDPVQNESEEDRLNKLLLKQMGDDHKQNTRNHFLPGHQLDRED